MYAIVKWSDESDPFDALVTFTMQNLMGMMPGPFGQSEPLWKKIVTNSAGGSK